MKRNAKLSDYSVDRGEMKGQRVRRERTSRTGSGIRFLFPTLSRAPFFAPIPARTGVACVGRRPSSSPTSSQASTSDGHARHAARRPLSVRGARSAPWEMRFCGVRGARECGRGTELLVKFLCLIDNDTHHRGVSETPRLNLSQSQSSSPLPPARDAGDSKSSSPCWIADRRCRRTRTIHAQVQSSRPWVRGARCEVRGARCCAVNSGSRASRGIIGLPAGVHGGGVIIRLAMERSRAIGCRNSS